jgi:hypothetical protein
MSKFRFQHSFAANASMANDVSMPERFRGFGVLWHHCPFFDELVLRGNVILLMVRVREHAVGRKVGCLSGGYRKPEYSDVHPIHS